MTRLLNTRRSGTLPKPDPKPYTFTRHRDEVENSRTYLSHVVHVSFAIRIKEAKMLPYFPCAFIEAGVISYVLN